MLLALALLVPDQALSSAQGRPSSWWLTLAILLKRLMLAYVAQELIATTLGGTGVWPIATATLAGVSR